MSKETPQNGVSFIDHLLDVLSMNTGNKLVGSFVLMVLGMIALNLIKRLFLYLRYQNPFQSVRNTYYIAKDMITNRVKVLFAKTSKPKVDINYYTQNKTHVGAVIDRSEVQRDTKSMITRQRQFPNIPTDIECKILAAQNTKREIYRFERQEARRSRGYIIPSTSDESPIDSITPRVPSSLHWPVGANNSVNSNISVAHTVDDPQHPPPVANATQLDDLMLQEQRMMDVQNNNVHQSSGQDFRRPGQLGHQVDDQELPPLEDLPNRDSRYQNNTRLQEQRQSNYDEAPRTSQNWGDWQGQAANNLGPNQLDYNGFQSTQRMTRVRPAYDARVLMDQGNSPMSPCKLFDNQRAMTGEATVNSSHFESDFPNRNYQNQGQLDNRSQNQGSMQVSTDQNVEGTVDQSFDADHLTNHRSIQEIIQMNEERVHQQQQEQYRYSFQQPRDVLRQQEQHIQGQREQELYEQHMQDQQRVDEQVSSQQVHQQQVQNPQPRPAATARSPRPRRRQNPPAPTSGPKLPSPRRRSNRLRKQNRDENYHYY